MNASIFRRPSAAIPPVLSLLALAVVLIRVALHGAARAPDEGAAAHLFQILIAAQVPIVAWFALTSWRTPGTVARVLLVQAVAIAAALAPVFWFGL